jgi:hypothetical protein
VGRREGSIERLLHRIESRIEEWRGRLDSRERELQTHREMLWMEAAEREKLLVRILGEEESRKPSLEEAAKEHRVTFVVHSQEAGKALEKFASERARLVSVVPGSASDREGADIKGSWLVFE